MIVMLFSRFISCLSLVILIILAGCFSVSADDKAVIDQIGLSRIDWTNQTIEASGEGVVPSSSEEPNRAKALLKAKNYAKMSAIAAVYMALDGTTISYESSGKDFMSDTVIRMRIDGYVRNVEVIDEKKVTEGADTIIVVTVRVPMYGDNGVMPAVFDNALGKHGKMKDIKSDPSNPDNSPSINTNAKGPFTSLIIDCIGLKLEKAAIPVMRRIDGSELFPAGSIKYDDNRMKSQGFVVYTITLDDAKRMKNAGNNPLIVKGRAKTGSRYLCDIMISDSDAQRIVEENKTSKFVEKCNLFVVTGENKEN